MKRKIFFSFIIFAVALMLGLGSLAITSHGKKLDNQFKKDYQKGDKVAALQDLLGSDRYAKDLRKVGYIIPDDGAIREDGLIASVTIDDGNQQVIIDCPGEGSDSFLVSIEIKNETNEKVNFGYSLDKDLNKDIEPDVWRNGKNVTDEVTLSSSEENAQLTKIRKEVNKLLDTMYHQIYD